MIIEGLYKLIYLGISTYILYSLINQKYRVFSVSLDFGPNVVVIKVSNTKKFKQIGTKFPPQIYQANYFPSLSQHLPSFSYMNRKPVGGR